MPEIMADVVQRSARRGAVHGLELRPPPTDRLFDLDSLTGPRPPTPDPTHRPTPERPPEPLVRCAQHPLEVASAMSGNSTELSGGHQGRRHRRRWCQRRSQLRMIDAGLKGVEFIAVNTDAQACCS